MEDLEALRESIADIDREIIGLVARRLETAGAIGRAKRAAGVPLRDFETERRVLDRASRVARDLGLRPEPVRHLMQTLIGAARDEQERLSYSAYAGAEERVAVVGGRGRMGGWLVDFLENQGHEVQAIDRGDDLLDGVEGTTIAFLATPQEAVSGTLDALTDARYPGVACDIASLKGHLRPAVERAAAAGVAVTSIHPMFGPGARTLSDRVICVCDCGNTGATNRVAGLFAGTAATLVPLDFEEHDQIVSYVLGLSHLVNLLFAEVLAAAPVPLDDLDRIGSTTFHAQMETTRTVVGEDPDLYYSIQRLNPFTVDLYGSVRDGLRILTDSIDEGDREAFVTSMERSRRWLEGGAPT